VLASASPRRQELLRHAAIPFTVQPSGVPEDHRSGETPEEHALRLAREKARAVSASEPGRLVLGADTIVLVDGCLLGKPLDPADATRMLRLLSGRSHQVMTAVCLIGPGFEDSRFATTTVTMTALDEDEIRDYVASGEPMDKAGAYAIQGVASRWVTAIDGCYFNVVGLPLPLVYAMLRAHGGL
ncbi:MAG: Maf family protein, partial [Terriglobales bacterium]